MVTGGFLTMALLYLAGKITDHLVEITLTTVAAYGSFLLAEHFHCSGVLAAMAILLVIAGRAVVVYPIAALFFGSRLRMSAPFQYVVFWGGLRGAKTDTGLVGVMP
jgi:NhaP-type Na+/H+ or K+/H+ antiporter